MATERTEAEKAMRSYLEALRYMQEGPLKTDLTFPERNLLALVGTYGNRIQLTQKLAGNFLGHKPSYVSELTSQLQERGYIEVSPDERDGRFNSLRLTEKGRKKFQGLCTFVHGNSTQNSFDAEPPLAMDFLVPIG